MCFVGEQLLVVQMGHAEVRVRTELEVEQQEQVQVLRVVDPDPEDLSSTVQVQN